MISKNKNNYIQLNLFYRLLGKFEEASHDLCESLKIDYDDQTNEWLTEVKPNAEKLRQHKLSVQRKKEEREVKFNCKLHLPILKDLLASVSTYLLEVQVA